MSRPDSRRLAEVSKRIKKGLDEVQGWPLRTPGRAVLGHAAAMVMAAQEAIEKHGMCWHRVVMLGDSQMRLNALVMHPDFGGDREMIQKHKWVTWNVLARLFNLLDSDVMLYLMDSWMTEISPEEYEAGDWDWPKNDPRRKEALQINLLTPTRMALLQCVYERAVEDEAGPVHWGDFQKADHAGGLAFMSAIAPLVAETKYLRPVVMEGEHRGTRASFASRLEPPGPLMDTLIELGHIVVEVDERFLRLN